jgi:EAL domain-containing protein (putative c-di-GMP-specific phosphodiesterase class I)
MMVARALRESELAPSCLKLEITETLAMYDAEATVRTLRELKGLGIRLAIDDFGTGYSSLTYLNRFPVDTLKIDRSFIARLGDDSENDAVVRTIIALAKSLGLVVTGEGIETIEQATLLRALGCDQGQGYYFARPQAGEVISHLLAAGPAQLPTVGLRVA